MTRHALLTLTLCAGCSNTLNDEGPERFELDAMIVDAQVDMPPAQDALRIDSPVRINEVTAKGDDFIELLNGGDVAVDLSGWAVADGSYDPADPDGDGRHVLPADTTLAPGEFLLLIKDVDHDFGLGDDDAVWLLDADGAIADATEWAHGAADPAWCRPTDGPSAFVTCDAATPGASNAGPPPPRCGDGVLNGDERCDGADLGDLTCGDLDFVRGELACDADCAGFDTRGCVRAVAVVMLNEVTSSGDDAIELYNAGEADADLTGWAVADDAYDPTDAETDLHRHALSGALPAGEYRVLRKGVDHDFGLSDEDGVRLYDADGRIVDQTAWTDDAATISWCRRPDATGQFMACETATFGAPN